MYFLRMYQLTLQFDDLPKSLNKSLRANRFSNLREMKRWASKIGIACYLDLPTSPLPKAKLKITRFSYRMLDYDGLVGSLKPVIDGLVSSGILIDDSWNVTGAWQVDQVFREKKKGPLLLIEVQEII